MATRDASHEIRKTRGLTSAVYVMESPALSMFKIGEGDPVQRLKDFRTGNPDIRFVAAVAHPSARTIEQRLHKFFDDERIKDFPDSETEDLEWFISSDRLAGWVDHFSSCPGTTNDIRRTFLDTFPTPLQWPWAGSRTPELVDGQLALPDVPLNYAPVVGSGEGQTSAISEDWYTPRAYVDAVRELFGGTIDLDPASCPEANLTVKADAIYTAEVDGIRHPWYGRVYLNPPWGNGGTAKLQFVEKAIATYERGEIECAILALNSNATTSSWFAPLFSYPICFPDHRVKHYGPGGSGGAPNSGTVFVYLGTDVERFVSIFSRFGRVVPPAYEQAA